MKDTDLDLAAIRRTIDSGISDPWKAALSVFNDGETFSTIVLSTIQVAMVVSLATFVMPLSQVETYMKIYPFIGLLFTSLIAKIIIYDGIRLKQEIPDNLQRVIRHFMTSVILSAMAIMLLPVVNDLRIQSALPEHSAKYDQLNLDYIELFCIWVLFAFFSFDQAMSMRLEYPSHTDL